MKKPLPWVPVYVDSWLFGSTTDELTPDEESVWLRLLLLSAKDSGYLRANENMGYPPAALAGLIRRPVELVERAVAKCIGVSKLKRLENGILYVAAWKKYALTPQYRSRLEHGSSPDLSSENKEKKSKGEGNNVSKKGTYVSKKGTSAPSLPENQARSEYRVSQIGAVTGNVAEGIRRAHEQNLKTFPELLGENKKVRGAS